MVLIPVKSTCRFIIIKFITNFETTFPNHGESHIQGLSTALVSVYNQVVGEMQHT